MMLKIGQYCCKIGYKRYLRTNVLNICYKTLNLQYSYKVLSMELNKLFLLNIGFSRNNGDWNYEHINSPFTRLYYVTKGSAEVIIDNKVKSLTEGNIYIIPAFTEHSDRNSGIFEHFYVHICEDAMAGRGVLDNYEFPDHIKATEFDDMLIRKLYEENKELSLKDKDPAVYDNKGTLIESLNRNHRTPVGNRLETMGMVFQIVGKFVINARPRFHISDPRISKAQRAITEKSDVLLTVEELAEEACMSKDYFIKSFRKELGVTPVQFIINDKLMKSKLMLASTSMSVKEIAYSLGYTDTSYFVRLFKKHNQISPLQYRHLFNDGMKTV